MQNPYKLFQQIISVSFFAIALFLIPSSVKAAGLLENCNGVSFCGSDLSCDFPGVFNKLGNGTTKYCLPHKDYPKCDKNNLSKSCSLRTDGYKNCALVGSITTPSKFDIACLRETDIPVDDEAKSTCETNADCTTGTGMQQCVLVTVYDTTGVDEFVSVKKCIATEKLPATILDKESGSCGSNGVCAVNQICLKGVHKSTSHVCYDKKYVSGKQGCTSPATACVTADNKKGVCMYALDAGAQELRCVDPYVLPDGPNAPSTQVCKTDNDCKSVIDHPYCLKNPITLKNNCFSQTSIFTTMGDPFKQFECNGKPCSCTLAGVKGCEPNGKESICAEHFDGTAGKAVCINFAENGAALGTGGGAADENPAHLAKPDVPAETFERFAPELQIEIPGLNFTEKIYSESGSDGTRSFSVPFLATYINAVYKYGIGFGVLIAVIMMMFMGFRWMTSFGNQKAVSEAKEGLGNAVLGLLLLLSAYTILYVINPELTNMKALDIIAPKQDAFTILEPDEADQDVPEVDSSGQPVPGSSKKIRICNDYESCKPFCNGAAANMSEVSSAASAKGVVIPSGLVDPRIKLAEYFKDDNCVDQSKKSDKKYIKCGVVFRGRDDETLFLPSVVKGVADAAKIAKSKGYILSIGSSYRSLKVQVEKVCAHVVNEPGKRPCGRELACPGGSNHMQGYAADICLAHPNNPNKCITDASGKATSCAKNTEIVKSDQNLRALNDIMFAAGWFKYCEETWHFEYTSKPSDQFRTKTY